MMGLDRSSALEFSGLLAIAAYLGAFVVQLLQAVEYAAEHGADLINMSLGGDYKEKNCQLADKVLGGAAAKGILICSSAGNTMQNLDAPGVNYYPAESPYVTCVSAIGRDNQYAKFSSFGKNVDFAAPGLQLKVACPKEKATGDQTGGGDVTVDAQEPQYSETTYQETSGTSFACSYITACMAYLKLAHPDHTIWSGRPGLADHVGFDSQGKDLYYGYGIPAFKEDSVLGPAQAEGVLKASLCEKKLVYSGRQIEPDYKAVYQGAEVPGCDHKLLTNGKTIGTHKIRLTLNGCFAEQPTVTKAYKIVPQAVKVKPVRRARGKGWTKALSCLMPFATLDVISETVLDFDEFSERAKQTIIEGHYDLVLLDLRLGGIKEDFIVDPEQMSGYKVLQIIKQCNRGTQVIMLTASNKAWNLKALMSGATGADGYFVKESPEYEFSDELSRANLRSLISDMEHCLEQRYLVEFWSFVRSLEQVESELAGEIRTQLEIAYEMAARAVKQEDYSYAFLALYQVVEIVTSALTDWTIDTSDKNSKLLYLPREKSYSKELVVPSDTEVLWRLKPLALERIGVNGIFPQKKKLAALYLQAWEKEDLSILNYL